MEKTNRVLNAVFFLILSCGFGALVIYLGLYLTAFALHRGWAAGG